MRIGRLLLRLGMWLGLALVVATVAFAIYVGSVWDRTWDAPAPDLHASKDPAVIARGEYLVFGPAHCVACHTGSVEDYTRFAETGERPVLAGGYAMVFGPLGTMYSRNITPDPETGIGRYTDPQVARMLRHGVRPDGQASVPDLMPFGDMSEDDMVAVLSYLRSQPPVRRETPANQWTTFGKVIRTLSPVMKPRLEVNPPKTAPPQEATVARGEYIARSVGNCAGCHSPFDLTTGRLVGPRFSGGGDPIEPVPFKGVDTTRWFRPPNLTPLKGSALSKFPDRATFVARFKQGRQIPGSPMPWDSFIRMSPEDMGALYEFLSSLPPSGQPAPEDPRVKQK